MTESIAPQNPEWVVLAEKADQGKRLCNGL